MDPEAYVTALMLAARGALTPGCPRCGGFPTLVLGGGHQAFCGTDDCDVFTWDPFEDAATFEANVQPVRIFHNGTEITEGE